MPYEFVMHRETGVCVVLGRPPDTGLNEDSPFYHNCDAMGCGSVGDHVIARFTIEPVVRHQMNGTSPWPGDYEKAEDPK